MNRPGKIANSALALVFAAASLLSPGSAFADPGDLVFTRTATPGSVRAQSAGSSTASPVRGGVPVAAPTAAQRAALARLAQRRSQFPHEIVAFGFDPARAVRGVGRGARQDLVGRMREHAMLRQSMGADAPVTATYPGMDTVRIAMLRVDFLNDRQGASSTGDGRFELGARDTINRPLDPLPHDRTFFQGHAEALRRYYRDQMGGRTVFEFTVYPTAQDSAFHLTDMADYGPWMFSPDIYHAAVKLFRDCLVAADTTEAIPWGTFDRFCIIHAGSDLQSDVNQDSPLDIPTFTIGVADTDGVAVGPAKADTIFQSVIAPESIRQDDYEGTINSVLTHEFGHLVYFWRDVYDVASGLPVVGYWSLMDVGNLLGNAVTFPNGSTVYATGILPPSVDPWQKRLVYDDVPSAPEPAYGTETSLPANGTAYTVSRVPISGEEYYLIENRLDDLNGNGQLTIQRDAASGVILGPASVDSLEYDFLVPGPGALVWQVDESVADYFGPRADPGFGLNVNRARFGLQIVEADGLDDLGDFNTPYALGTTTDPWFVGNATRLNDTTFPRLRTNSKTDPHLDIEFTSPPGPVMTFKVTRQWDLAGWPAKVVQPKGGIAPLVAGLGPDSVVVVAWAGGDSCVHARRIDGSPYVGGAGNDIVFRAGKPLGQLAAVPRARTYGGDFLAVAEAAPETLASGQTGALHFLRFSGTGGSGLGVETIPCASPVTAGPASGPPLPPPYASTVPVVPPVFVGLADGQVIQHAFTSGNPGDVTTSSNVRNLAGPITGLAAGGDLIVATSSTQFGYGTDPVVEVGAPGHRLQPIVFRSQEPVNGDPGIVANTPRIALIDRTVGTIQTVAGVQPAAAPPAKPLGESVNPPAIGDVDGDGLPEILFSTASGRVGYWNGNGSISPGWPPEVEKEGFATGAGPLPWNADNGSYIVSSLGNGILTALDAAAKPAPGFPLGTSVGARGTPAIAPTASPDAGPVLFVAGGDSLLYGLRLDVGGVSTSALPWLCEGGDAGRSYVSHVPFSFSGGVAASPTPILAGSFKCYPNPARQSPVTFAFRMNAPGTARIRIFDSAAREVESIERPVSASDNAIVWDPAGRTSGLYVARIEVSGQVVTQPFAIVR